MTDFTNQNGEVISVERNPDGSYTASGADGGSTTYGENAAANIAHDWGLEGTGFSLDQVEGPNDPGTNDPGSGDGLG